MASNLQIFIVELIGTFILVVFATGSIIYDAQINGTPRFVYAAIAPFIALILGVYSFGKISLAHFNPAVTIGYYITGHISKTQIVYYFAAELIGALLGSLFVMKFIGTEANLGINAPNYEFSLPLIFGIEVLASGLLMAVIFTVVYTKGLKGFSGIAIGGIVGLDIFFFAFISGASMNPARALAPAIFSGILEDLWLYWTATYVGTSITAFLFRRTFAKQRLIEKNNKIKK
jgi:aquaporin Z